MYSSIQPPKLILFSVAQENTLNAQAAVFTSSVQHYRATEHSHTYTCIFPHTWSVRKKRNLNVLVFSLYSVPGVTIATDIICGFPTETAEVGTLTYSLLFVWMHEHPSMSFATLFCCACVSVCSVVIPYVYMYVHLYVLCVYFMAECLSIKVWSPWRLFGTRKR